MGGGQRWGWVLPRAGHAESCGACVGVWRFSWRWIREPPSKSLCREGLWLDLFVRGISLIARKRDKTGARGPAQLWETGKMTMAGHGIWVNAWGLGGSVPQGGIVDFDWLIPRDLTGVFNHILKHFVFCSPQLLDYSVFYSWGNSCSLWKLIYSINTFKVLCVTLILIHICVKLHFLFWLFKLLHVHLFAFILGHKHQRLSHVIFFQTDSWTFFRGRLMRKSL